MSAHRAEDILETWPDTDARPLVLRRLQPRDAALLATGFRLLSPQSRYQRFFTHMRELPPAMLRRLSHPDRRVEHALIVVKPTEGGELPVAVGRFSHHDYDTGGEFALVVGDPWHRQGIARRLMGHIIDEARRRGRSYLEGSVLATNEPMLALARALGFEELDSSEGPAVRVVRLDLAADARRA